MAKMTFRQQLIDIWQKQSLCESLSRKKVLIAGASGLIGNCLTKTLLYHPQKNIEVYAIGRNLKKLKSVFSEELEYNRLHLIETDISKPFNLDIDPDYIIDCASNANPSEFVNHPVETITSNIIGVNNLLMYGLNHGMMRFLYVSSGEVYGENDSPESKENDSGYVDCTNPRSCYPTSKRAAENLCVAYKQEYGANVVIARPCHTYGPNFNDSDDRAYAQFIGKAANNEDIVLNSPGLLKRSWCYVVDCITGILTILVKGENGQAYNIAGESFTIKDFASMIAEVAGTNIKFNVSMDKTPPIITRGILNSEKLHDLGWTPIRTHKENLATTIYETKLKLINDYMKTI